MLTVFEVKSKVDSERQRLEELMLKEVEDTKQRILEEDTARKEREKDLEEAQRELRRREEEKEQLERQKEQLELRDKLKSF